MHNPEIDALVAKIDAYYDKKIELLHKHEAGELSNSEYINELEQLEERSHFMNPKNYNQEYFDKML